MTSSEPAPGRRRRREDDGQSLGRPEDVMLTTAQVAQLLHVTPKTVMKFVQDGRLIAHRLPGTRQYLFWRHDILQLIEASVVKPDDMGSDVDAEAHRTATGGQ